MNILIGITGGIAAQKLPKMVQLLCEQGHSLRVVLTHAAEQFVDVLLLEKLTNHPVSHYQWQSDAMEHIDLARFANLIVIAPATNNIIAKLAHGIADDLLSTTCVTTTAPIVVVPAMNREMWANEANQANINALIKRDIDILGPTSGRQACGEVGYGRMLEPEDIVAQLQMRMQSQPDLTSKKILITAGPTREPIDSIRYLSNRSSGRMGYALAAAAKNCGADVTLISGPTSLIAPNVRVVNVTTAAEMYAAVMQYISNQDIFISTAAVADYTPVNVSQTKIKKQQDTLSLELVRTKDILKSVAKLNPRPVCVGFAAEDENLLENAQQKLNQKNLDFIVANQISDSFDRESNTVTILDKSGKHQSFENISKCRLAYEILSKISPIK